MTWDKAYVDDLGRQHGVARYRMWHKSLHIGRSWRARIQGISKSHCVSE